MVKTSPSNVGCVGSTPGQGAKMPHALQPKNQNRNETVTNLQMTFKMVHIGKKNLQEKHFNKKIFHSEFWYNKGKTEKLRENMD